MSVGRSAKYKAIVNLSFIMTLHYITPLTFSIIKQIFFRVYVSFKSWKSVQRNIINYKEHSLISDPHLIPQRISFEQTLSLYEFSLQ